MRFDSRRQLTALDEQCRAKAQVARTAQQFRNDLIAALGVARAELATAEATLVRRPIHIAGLGQNQASTSVEVTALRLRVRELAEAEAEATSKWEAARYASAAISQLTEFCTNFAREKGLPLPVSLPLIGADRAAGVAVQGRVQ